MAALRVTDNNGRIDPWAILGWFFNIVAGIALAFALALADRVSGLELWRAETSGNRYTSMDRAADAARDHQEKQALWKEMNLMQRQWLGEVSAINVTLAEIKTELRQKPK